MKTDLAMEIRRPAWALLALMLTASACAGATGCASVRTAGFERLPEAEKARFARYRQFMTARQQERFLLLETQDARDAAIEAMHVEERLAEFPAHVQEAIWNQQVVPGMSPRAVILSWGSPERIDRREDPLKKGLPKRETWRYGGDKGEVIFLEGLVQEVVP